MSRYGDWCCTYSGVSFYPLDPREDEIHIEDIAHALSLLCRFGGHCREFYSVAEHSVLVLRIVAKSTTDRRVLRAALLHDASEAYLIDVPRPIKSHLTNYKRIEAALQACIDQRFDSAPGLGAELVHHADEVALATEKRDLMPQRSAAWAWLPDPMADVIAPLSPRAAEIAFLDAFTQLRADAPPACVDPGVAL